jgi:HTH-type transcriptional regulator / antitoxin HigA
MIKDRIRPIRSEADYLASVDRVEAIMDATPDSPEGEELEILAALIERYQDEHFPMEAPTPLGAIQFRMDQLGLSPKDLIPQIGSRSRVSEILSGTRSLSVDMIRALHQDYGIPVHVLIGDGGSPSPQITQEFSKPVAKALSRLGLLKPLEKFENFVHRAFGEQQTPALLRQTRTSRTNARTDHVALQAWCAGVRLKSDDMLLDGEFVQGAFDREALRSIAKLSTQDDAFGTAQAALGKLGIVLVRLEHLPGTHLDGAVMRRSDGAPVIALTVRRNRIDNFWFTLLHECAHLALHMNDTSQIIFDDLEIGSSDMIEREADEAAKNALIPPELWRTENMGKFASVAYIKALARSAEVHEAIVAGRWQKQNNDYRKFSRLLGHGMIGESAL